MTAFFRRHGRFVLSVALAFCAVPPSVSRSILAQDQSHWPQFRGPHSTGVAAAHEDPPVELSVDRNLIWKTPVPYGHGSPCIWGERLWLAGFDRQQQKLQVLCLDRSNGHVSWCRDVQADNIETVHPTSSPATATIATDGERLYVYFGSVGLLCYDLEGQPLWDCRLAIPHTPFGSGTSPVVADEFVILNRDSAPEPFLLAIDRRTGAQVWKQPLENASVYGTMSCATPVIWYDEIVLHRTGEIAAYKLNNGERSWWYSIAGTGNSTPVIGDDILFVNTWNNFGEPELRVELPGFATLLKEHDKNQDKKLGKNEFPEDLAMSRRPEVSDDVPGAQMFLKPMFGRLDANKDGQLTAFEWLAMRVMLSAMTSEHGVVAISRGGKGDISQTNLLWKESRGVGEVPSVLFHEGRVYMVKDGGILTCLDAQSGKVIYRERLGGAGAYHSSPILAAGRIYIASTQGCITVIAAGDAPQVLSQCDLGEPILATPAVLDDCFYVRTHDHMYAFGRSE